MNDAAVSAFGGDPDLDLAPGAFVKNLEPHERVLVDLKDLLYEGSWDHVLTDLRAAKENRPHVYRLSNAIERDLRAIERMKAYETKHQVSLSALLKQRGAQA
ncbi:MAG TPA: hypothetical protein VKX17_14860 [Planctomycetota bacterium]|nr:hypothetical protein [Planctomycetota bacterium]